MWKAEIPDTPLVLTGIGTAVSTNASSARSIQIRTSCFLRAFQRSENVLPSLDRTQVRKNHVWARLSWSLLLSLSDADSASLPKFLHNIRRLQNSRIPAFKEQSLWWFRSIFRPDYGPDRDIYFPDYGFFAHTGSEMDLRTPLCANMSPIQFKLL